MFFAEQPSTSCPVSCPFILHGVAGFNLMVTSDCGILLMTGWAAVKFLIHSDATDQPTRVI
jgi:hypothetical protein